MSKTFSKEDTDRLAEVYLKNNEYTTICQGISKPEEWKRDEKKKE